jgi:hypothetical protein
MGIREIINRKPALTTGVAVAVVGLIVVATMWNQTLGGASDDSTKAAYTVDDGATWFVDQADRITPFRKDGAEAVGAALFTSGEGKSQFIGYLYRHAAATRERLKDPSAQRLEDLQGGEQTEMRNAIEVKATKSPTAKWISADSPDAAAILQVKSSDGAVATAVEPR